MEYSHEVDNMAAILGPSLRTTNKKTLEKVKWPDGAKCAASFTLDYDAQQLWAAIGMGGLLPLSEGEFGGRVGIWRYLDLMDKWNIKATFFVVGLTAERYPETVKEMAKRGHEVANHGYTHQDMSKASRQDEKDDILRCSAVIEELAGKKPIGFRSPGAEFSENTIDILLDEGFIYHSTCQADDIPYRWEIEGKKKELLEIPFQWHLTDSMHFLASLTWGAGHISSPTKVYDIWSSEFDGAYAMGRHFHLLNHDFIIGKSSRIMLLNKLIEHVKKAPKVWYCRMDEMARYWKKNYWD